MDPRGDQAEGDPITLVYSSLDPGDAANWPNGAKVRDTAIYNGVLIGRDNISQEDLWVRTWEGNPAFLSGRTHPMGILVEERGMAWNYPTGNEDIIYFVFTFYNVTASDPAVYNNPSIDPAIRSEIAAIGADFQARNEARFGINIPNGGSAPDVTGATVGRRLRVRQHVRRLLLGPGRGRRWPQLRHRSSSFQHDDGL